MFCDKAYNHAAGKKIKQGGICKMKRKKKENDTITVKKIVI